MSTLHLFPRLPLELRFTIWELTVVPREVEVRIVVPLPSDRVEAYGPHLRDWTYINSVRFKEAMRNVPTSTRAGRRARKKARGEWKDYQPHIHIVSSVIPAALHACREARNHGLYQQVSMDVDEPHTSDRRYVWLNLEIDLLDIGTTYLMYFVPIASSINRLKFSREAADEWWYNHEKDTLSIFANVEEIHVGCLDDFWNWGDELLHFSWPCVYEKLVFIEPDLPGGPQAVGHTEMRRCFRRELKRQRLLEGFQDDWTDGKELVD
jgi:hypothetical protein